MHRRSHLLNVVVAVFAVPFTIWWFVPGETAPTDPFAFEAVSTAERSAEPQSLQGAFVDEAGAPVAAVWVVRFEDRMAMTLASTRTDGRFAVDRRQCREDRAS